MKRYINLIGWVVIFGLALLPLVFWITMKPLDQRFANSVTTLTSLGQIAGLVGIVLFAVSMVLTARFQWMEDIFGGMNKVYSVHHIVGGIAFILLLVHPLALSAAYIPVSVKRAALLLLPGSDWAINAGISAMLLLMALLIITFFVKLPYQIWRFTHQFLGFSFMAAGVHAMFIRSDVSVNPMLKGYIMVFVILGTAVFTYRTLLGRWLVKRFAYTVVGVRQLADSVVEIELTPRLRRIKFAPGQFIFLRITGNNITREAHPFSISSSASEKSMKLIVKSLGDFTSELAQLKPGMQATLEGPYGRFSFFNYQEKQQIWIAGGIGITPFLSMARSLESYPEYSIDLYYSVSEANEAVHLTELSELVSENQNLRFMPWYSNKYGRLTGEKVQEFSGDLTAREIFLCGPPEMMKDLRSQFKLLGVSGSKIHSEEFKIQ